MYFCPRGMPLYATLKYCPCGTNSLPFILIELEMELDPKRKSSTHFYGENYSAHKNEEERYGIRFECKYEPQLGDGLEASISEGKIPYEYYTLSWTTYANSPYQVIRRPLHFLAIDTTNSVATASFNYYNRTLFTSVYDDATRVKAKNDFRIKLEEAFDSTHLSPISDKRKFGIDSKKVVLESLLSIYEDSIALENRGSGMESFIKTQIALDKANKLDVLLLEEPENHLSFLTLRKMLDQISKQQAYSQIIVTTHNNLIASGLNLNNILWITDNEIKSLRSVDENIAKFFVKSVDNSFLQLLLSKKAFLVEGPTECLLLPYFYKQLTNHTLEADDISIVACNGISYKNYLAIAKATDKRIAVITDNDKKADRIDSAINFNNSNTLQHIFMGATVDDWTWEICIYNANKKLLDDFITVEVGAKYLFHGDNLGAVQGKMLNNKVETAYQMLTSQKTFIAPDHIKEAIRWINE